MTRKITIYDDCDNVIHVEPWPHSDNMAMKWVEAHYPYLDWTLPDKEHIMRKKNLQETEKIQRDHILQLLDALLDLRDEADDACRFDDRTKHFRNALENATVLISELTEKYEPNEND